MTLRLHYGANITHFRAESGNLTAVTLSRPSLWVRTVAGPSVGFGHLRRSLILSRMLSDHFAPLFLCDAEDRWTMGQASANHWKSRLFEVSSLWEQMLVPAGVLIDTREDRGLLELIGEAHARSVPVMSIHDLGLNPLPSDLVVDGSVLPVARDISWCDTESYYGPAYMILDPSYAALHRKRRVLRDRLSLVVVNLGGGASKQHFRKVLQGLSKWGRRLDVIGIPGFVDWGQAEWGERDWSALNFRWARQAERVDRLISRADVAITAGGLSAYEALCAGTPLAATYVDEFQQVTITNLATEGACIDLGPAGLLKTRQIAQVLSDLEADPAKRQELSIRGRQIVDGRGAERVSRLIYRFLSHRSERTQRATVS